MLRMAPGTLTISFQSTIELRPIENAGHVCRQGDKPLVSRARKRVPDWRIANLTQLSGKLQRILSRAAKRQTL